MDDFKKNIQKITSNKPSGWKEKAAERLSRPWLKEYSSRIARRILALIEDDKELNQAKLAKMVGVSAQQISKIVSGKENLTLETIYKLSKALNYELISFPPYKYSRPSTSTLSYNVTIDSKSHLVSREVWWDINRILERNTSGETSSSNVCLINSKSFTDHTKGALA